VAPAARHSVRCGVQLRMKVKAFGGVYSWGAGVAWRPEQLVSSRRWDEIVAEWLAGGKRAGSVMGLSSMFANAASMKAGRLIDRNPFEKLGISRGKGRRDQQPPSEQEAWEIIACARRVSCPSFAAWLQVAAFTGMRPGELDALRWVRIDFVRDRIIVSEQFNAATRKFDTPKNHQCRGAPDCARPLCA
jgi:integrase